jgi:hypothetical protein
MFGLDQLLQDIFDGIRRGTFTFLGLLCFLVFVLNACLLVWLIVKKGAQGLARCPKCGRPIACPHCEDDAPEPEAPT